MSTPVTVAVAVFGFSMILATRQLTDGTVLVVGERSSDPAHPGYSPWSSWPDLSRPPYGFRAD